MYVFVIKLLNIAILIVFSSVGLLYEDLRCLPEGYRLVGHFVHHSILHGSSL